MTNLQEKTTVSYNENYKILYERKRWYIFSWRVKSKAESMGKDLVITTTEDYEKIYINGKEAILSTD